MFIARFAADDAWTYAFGEEALVVPGDLDVDEAGTEALAERVPFPEAAAASLAFRLDVA